MRLRRARAYRLRLTVIDALGAQTRSPLGRVKVPRRPGRRLRAEALVAVALPLAGSATAATAPNPGNQAAIDPPSATCRSAGPGGGFGGPGRKPGRGISAWAALALAAAGINPQDQKR